MSQNTKIEWCDHTANLWWGCQKVSAGCDNCYAEAWSNRWGNDLWGSRTLRKPIQSVWDNLRKWQKSAQERDVVNTVFCGSMMDIFETPKDTTDGGSTSDARQRLFEEYVPACPNLLFFFLTKRPGNIRKYIPSAWMDHSPPNVMFGITVCDMKSYHLALRDTVDLPEDLPVFYSMEPLLEPLRLNPLLNDPSFKRPEWVIVGGESGPKRRAFDVDWARQIREDCKTLGINFFMKQVDKVRSIPEDLMIRQTPPRLDALNAILDLT